MTVILYVCLLYCHFLYIISTTYSRLPPNHTGRVDRARDFLVAVLWGGVNIHLRMGRVDFRDSINH